MSEVKLKNCPCCGGVVMLDREDIFCDVCRLSMKIDDRLYNGEADNYEEAREQAIQAWNTRKPMDDIVERLEEHKSYNQMMLKKFPKMGTIENAIYKTQRDTYENAIEIVKGGVE